MVVISSFYSLVLPFLSLYRSSYAFEIDLSSSPLHSRTSKVRDELGPLLSKDAVIVDSKSGNMTEATKRWQLFASPTFDVVVEVATEDDIVQTVIIYVYRRLFIVA